MSKIISVHSFRGGTGKSNTIANLAALLASDGMRVGVIDTDIQSPGIHAIFGVTVEHITYSLNDYLWGRCSINDAVMEVTQALRINAPTLAGRVFLIPASLKTGEIARVLREGYDVGLLNEGFQSLLVDLQLDVLLIDTHPGLNEETLLSIAISDALVIIMRPDQQDYQGTGVTVEVARQLGVPNLVIAVNRVPEEFAAKEIQARVEQTYGCPVIAVLPHSKEMMILASAGVFVLHYPDHPMVAELKRLAKGVMAEPMERERG